MGKYISLLACLRVDKPSEHVQRFVSWREETGLETTFTGEKDAHLPILVQSVVVVLGCFRTL